MIFMGLTPYQTIFISEKKSPFLPQDVKKEKRLISVLRQIVRQDTIFILEPGVMM